MMYYVSPLSIFDKSAKLLIADYHSNPRRMYRTGIVANLLYLILLGKQRWMLVFFTEM